MKSFISFCGIFLFCSATLVGQNRLSFSHKRGFYEKPIALELKSKDSSGVIYYTTNGDSPTTSSQKYTGTISLDYLYNTPNRLADIPNSPLGHTASYHQWKKPAPNLEKSHIIRAALFVNDTLASNIETRTYIIDSTIQQRFHYPVISLISDEKNFFDNDTGIYVLGKRFDPGNPEWSGNAFETGKAWEKPVHIEYFEKDGAVGFSQNAGIRTHGDKIRHAAQKPMKLYARNEYGKKYFSYPIFPDSTIKKFKRLILRTTVGDWNHSIFADELAHSVMKGTNIETQDFQPAVVFLNGEYWGIHTIRERIDKHFLAAHFDVPTDSLDLMIGEGWGIEGKSKYYFAFRKFVEEHKIKKKKHYAYVKSMVDIDNFIDYHIAEMYFKNYDWPANNTKTWRPQNQDSLYQWLFFDLDGGFGDYTFNAFEHATAENSDQWNNVEWSTVMLRKFLKNKEFKQQFLDRYRELLNTRFQPENVIQQIDELEALYGLEIEVHIQRWHYPESEAAWKENINKGLREFAKHRPCYVKKHIEEYFKLKKFDCNCVCEELISE